MEITSSVFKNGEQIPMRYTCDGEYINPPLQISAVPENTKSLSLIVEDPDAPVGLWIHWMIWDIEPNTKQIPSGATTIGTVGKILAITMPGMTYALQIESIDTSSNYLP